MKKTKMVKLFNDTAPKEGCIDVTISFSDKCNYECSYCSEYNNSVKFNSFEYMEKLLHSVCEDLIDKKVTFYIFGGEPTIIPRFDKLIKGALKKYKNIEFEIQTNTSRKITFFEKFKDLGGRVKFNCSLQYHQTKNIDDYFNVVEFLNDNDLIHQVDLMLERENSDKIIRAYHTLVDMGLASILKLNFVDFKYNPRYSELFDQPPNNNKEDIFEITFNDKKKILYSENQLRKNGLDNFSLMNCRAGSRNLVIDKNGDIFYCKTHRGKDKASGNVFVENAIRDIISKEWVLCTFGKCFCEIYLEKQKPGALV
jgi:sulfatase maturation enzyme AslB (radical SAM superfamily)